VKIVSYRLCSRGCSQQNDHCEKVDYTCVNFSKKQKLTTLNNTESENYEFSLV